ncbi:hypothetical protein [Streptococcus macacae]|uniref:Uncharacterized protein n=1 Tax=Streptococcus macacae NCTC 11558 TaxID=764298 RepID=G5JU82_9STRE|nr:hypothetical protein [Streptococcus macacae]EHJ52523.1 hypothetical protein STRMA_0623 [Streptococcus macacae NCTC 11558]SUN78447.1 Uncharacterised protein [Streptococcus macacae NCTC 11558]
MSLLTRGIAKKTVASLNESKHHIFYSIIICFGLAILFLSAAVYNIMTEATKDPKIRIIGIILCLALAALFLFLGLALLLKVKKKTKKR